MIEWNDFVDGLATEIKCLAAEELGGVEEELIGVLRAAVDGAKDDIARWVKQAANGDLTAQEFEDLVEGMGAFVSIETLTQAGVALSRAERFRKGLIRVVVDGVFRLVP